MIARKRALVLMTALLPTIGHKNLIWYAISLIKTLDPNGYVEVIVSHRSFEPIKGEDRIHAFEQEFSQEIQQGMVIFRSHADDNVPQNPEDHDSFWYIWKNIILRKTNIRKGDIVVSSEMYGYKLAEVLDCTHYQYDLGREINNVKGTNVRNDILPYYNQIMESFKPYLQTRITLFGAESCGKTTTSNLLVNHFLTGYYLPEWARPYLESIGSPEITPEIMETITNGQHALQLHSQFALTKKPFIVQDTDLLSTIGYYILSGYEVPERIEELFRGTKSDIYFVMSTNIPFEPDPLRYGGDKRESDDAFWIALLEKYECNYVVVDQDSLVKRTAFVAQHARQYVNEKFKAIREFVRD